MISQASPEMQKMIEKDETLTRKRVSSAYNDLIIINYSAFSTSGATELSEKFVGLQEIFIRQTREQQVL